MYVGMDLLDLSFSGSWKNHWHRLAQNGVADTEAEIIARCFTVLHGVALNISESAAMVSVKSWLLRLCSAISVGLWRMRELVSCLDRTYYKYDLRAYLVIGLTHRKDAPALRLKPFKPAVR